MNWQIEGFFKRKKMIQLLSKEKKILYELPKSELFPNYGSVLKEAIKLQINLSGLFVESQIINNVVWRSLNFERMVFLNCTLINNSFVECEGWLEYINCDLRRLKIKKSKLSATTFDSCNISNLSCRNSKNWHFTFTNCNLTGSIFKNNELKAFSFKDCQLSDSHFENCEIMCMYFKNSEDSKEWYNNLAFLDCKFEKSKFESNIDLSKLLIWNINYEGIDFEDYVRFVEIESKNSKVIICCFSNVVWWYPYHQWRKDLPFKHSFNEFIVEVKSGFPTTGIYPQMDDFEVEDELLAICEYIKYWEKRREE